jgi:Flp pilus assembly pilin Flp
MTTIKTRIRDFLASKAGPTATEYAVMLSLIILASLSGISLMGIKLSDIFTFLGSSLPNGSA